MRTSRPAVFLDRDGVLNDEQPRSPRTAAEWRWLPGALAALATLARAGLPLFVVTNQSAIARGFLEPDELDRIHARLTREAAAAGGPVEAVYHCPHGPDDDCACRKPRPGMLERAAEEHGIALARSFLIGDALRDLAAARAVGVAPILVRTGKGEAELAALRDQPVPESVADDLPAAAALILANPR